MILQIIMLLLLLAAAPMAAGLLINSIVGETNRGMGLSYLSGFFVLLAMFQLIAVPVVFLDAWGFPTIVKLYTAVLTLLAGGGIVRSLHFWRSGNAVFKTPGLWGQKSTAEKVQWLMVFVLIAFQLVMAVTCASFDGDDAYYVVQSVVTDETDTLYRILPYTGRSTGLDARHSLAVFPLWIAYIARMAGVHSTILCHSVLPLFLLPVSYLIYYEIGKRLFAEKTGQLSTYMLYICLLQIFGNVSIYSGATFLLMRTWQGKSVLANVVIPMIFLIFLMLLEEKNNKMGLWVLLFTVNIVAAMMSTASVFLNSFLIVVMAAVMMWKEKRVAVFAKMMACCVPCAAYALLYVLQ